MTRPHRTALNVVITSMATFAQIVNQFLFFGILAAVYGATASIDADSLAKALAVPMVLAAIITGSLSYVLVPDLVAKFEVADSRKSAWQLASFSGLLALCTSAIATGILFWKSNSICAWLYGGGPETIALTADLLRILSVQVIFLGLLSWSQAVLHSMHRFLLPAIGGVLGTGVSLVIAYLYGSIDIRVIAWAINAGSLVSLSIHLTPLLPNLKIPYAESENLRRLVAGLWPLLLGAAFIRLDPLVDRVLASELDQGSVAHINYAQRIMMALLAIGTSSLSLIAFPQLAERFTVGGKAGFAEHFALAFRRTALLVVPIVIGFSCFAVRIIADLLQRGEFTPADSRVVGYLVVVLMGMFVGASFGELLARGFYVLGDTKTPTLIGVVSLTISLAVKFLLFKYLIGIWGIAVGVSTYFLLSSTILSVVLYKRVAEPIFSGALSYIGQATVASAFACCCCYLVYSVSMGPSWLGSTWVAGPVGVLSYTIALLGLRNSDALQLMRMAENKLGTRWKSWRTKTNSQK